MNHPDRLVIRRPDDWHLHLRDGAMMAAVLPATAATFARAIVMPNLKPPVTTAAAAEAYRRRIRDALPPGAGFEPLMTCYLTDATDPDDLAAGARDGIFSAVKLYPAGATTNSQAGVTRLDALGRVLERMEAIGLPLLVHGEVTDAEVDIFDREAVFLDRVLEPLRRRHQSLRVVVEHATTKEAVDYVTGAGGAPIAATITPHHLEYNRTDMLAGGIRPHYYCLPVAKREAHRLALRKAATSGDPRFFLGTDSAPHPIADKESACGCAGVFNAHAALSIYATVFEEESALGRLESFASLHGPAFYGLPANEERIVLDRRAPILPDRVTTRDGVDVHVHPGHRPPAWTVAAADSP